MQTISKKVFILFIFLSIFIIASLSVGFYFFYKYKINANKEEVKKEQAERLFKKISNLYYIPNNERPAIATVSDPENFKKQSVFKESEEGDTIFVFSENKKAILYRPSIDKIIDIVSIVDDNNIQSQ